VLPTPELEVLLYEQQHGRSPFADWFDALDRQAAAKVTIAVERLRLGNLSNVKSVGAGVRNAASIGGRDIGSIWDAMETNW
jgi:putative component of toxin-antitoxin plasmid stabilization module